MRSGVIVRVLAPPLPRARVIEGSVATNGMRMEAVGRMLHAGTSLSEE